MKIFKFVWLHRARTQPKLWSSRFLNTSHSHANIEQEKPLRALCSSGAVRTKEALWPNREPQAAGCGVLRTWQAVVRPAVIGSILPHCIHFSRPSKDRGWYSGTGQDNTLHQGQMSICCKQASCCEGEVKRTPWIGQGEIIKTMHYWRQKRFHYLSWAKSSVSFLEGAWKLETKITSCGENKLQAYKYPLTVPSAWMLFSRSPIFPYNISLASFRCLSKCHF